MSNPICNPSNGHYYEFIENSATWLEAYNLSKEKYYNGDHGYLVTITSKEENDFIFNTVLPENGNSWLGASDQDSEGVWKWVSGPEDGNSFWQGSYSGFSLNGEYSNWGASLDNYNNEDYATTYSINSPRGKWNDASESGILSYVIEYGSDDSTKPLLTQYDLATEPISQILPWTSEYSWNRSAVVHVGTNSYIVVKLEKGGLQNAQPGQTKLLKAVGTGWVDVTSTFLPNASNFKITREILVADLNGDGYEDFFLNNHGEEPISGLFPGEQNAIYLYDVDSKKFIETLTVGKDFSHGSSVGDFNSDGKMDIFINNLGSIENTPSYLLRQTSANVFERTDLATSFVNSIGPLTGGLDVNNDGDWELATTGKEGQSFIVWSNLDSSYPVQSISSPLPMSTSGVFEIVCRDFDGNGNHDALVVGNNNGLLCAALYLDAGKNTQRLVEPIVQAGLQDIIVGGIKVFTDDFDQNGTIDFELLTYLTDWSSLRVTIFMRADGTSLVSRNVSVTLNVVYADQNGDGILDLITDKGGRLNTYIGSISGAVIDGGTSDDTYDGGTGADTVEYTSAKASITINLAIGTATSTAGNDAAGIGTDKLINIKNIVLSSYSDTLVGSTEANVITGSAGNDSIDGGLNTDTAVYLAARTNYTVTETDSGFTVINITGTDGTDKLVSIERLQFTDQAIAYDADTSNSAGGIYRLYKAALDRTPDLGGLGYWIAQADAGTKDAVRMATDFTYADEVKTLYGVQTADNYMTGEDITALVTKIYENVLNRAPDAGGRDYYAGQITTKSKTVGQVLAEISDSTENKLAVADLIGTGIEYTPWVG